MPLSILFRSIHIRFAERKKTLGYRLCFDPATQDERCESPRAAVSVLKVIDQAI